MLLDRKTGQLISANPYVKVTWATHIDKETGRPEWTETTKKAIAYTDEIETWPHITGGTNWFPVLVQSAHRAGLRQHGRLGHEVQAGPGRGDQESQARRLASRREDHADLQSGRNARAPARDRSADRERRNGKFRSRARTGPALWSPPAVSCSPAS